MRRDLRPFHDLQCLIEDYSDLNPSSPTVYTEIPTALQFCKQVSKALPCTYPTASLLENHRAIRWTKKDFIDSVREKVEVAVTPNGRADSLCEIPGYGTTKVFLRPAELNMDIEELFDKLELPSEKEDPVYYLQSQNSNLINTPLKSLFKDLPQNFDFAEQVLSKPEAVNIWIGDERSITTAHRDPYENLYIVLRGSKVFTIWPPVQEATLDVRWFRTGKLTFDHANSAFSTMLDVNASDPTLKPPTIPWVTVDPLLPREELNRKHGLYKHAKPQTVVVEPGQMLYLPSGWFHHVTQRCGTWDDGSKAPCISVNYWYDHEYEGEKYVMRQLVDRLTEQIQEGMAGVTHWDWPFT